MNVNIEKISMELKKARKQKKLTQEVLARKAGLSRASIIAAEKGTDMSLSTFLGILDALEMSLEMNPRPIDRGRVAGRFPTLDELKKMRLAGEI